jgi:hypothetical protein
MELYRSEVTGELLFSSFMCYEEEFKAYLHQDDLREFYMDDDEIIHGLFHEVEPYDIDIYEEWCYQNDLKPEEESSTKLYDKNLKEYGDFYK